MIHAKEVLRRSAANRNVVVRMLVTLGATLVMVPAPSFAAGAPAHDASAYAGDHLPATGTSQGGTQIRPFRVSVPAAALDDLKRRVLATRWPDKETVSDSTQGVQLAKVQELARYWATEYDWRKAEAKLNALPQFVTTIDGVDIYFIHVKSRHPNALPLIVTHGWPGSILEMVKTIGPLTDPTAFGGRAEDAFDVVIPSIPGYSFSARPSQTGWGPDRVARAWDVLMKRLGYNRYVSQGGDHGSVIVTVFPGEIYRAPESWTRQAYRNVIYFSEVDKGGHFAAWEEPNLFAQEMRAAFRSLR